MFENKPKFGPEQFPAGTNIIRQGDAPDKFYIITRGRVAVLLQPPDGLDAVLDYLGPGDFFGEVGLLRQSRRMATVRAETAVDVMTMDYATFKTWIDGSSLIAQEIKALAAERTRDTGPLEPAPAPNIPPMPDDFVKTAVESAEQYEAEAVIVRQGEQPDRFYIITEGFVSVTHEDETGKQHQVAYLTAGDYFGEIGLLEGSQRIATVTAVTHVKVVSFDRDTFRRWMRQSPSSQDDIAQTAARRRKNTGRLSLPGQEET
ncbi:cyclic nucleotide-binding domain-containing protein [Candidatus Leptofilum sp.]|uniref:cyclic nucleotide-binding domain-containing protein n=1 Tax=Candidatus Leptofilum sp. TaxID=3241576 RepID=UPI003B5BE150